jgi:SPP1 gp7 family putative phage head morphogenesis protein
MNIEFQSTQSFNKLQTILRSIRDRTLTQLAGLPAENVYRYRFLKNYTQELNRIIDGKAVRLPNGSIRVQIRPLDERLANEIPTVKVFEDSYKEGFNELGIHSGFPLIDKQALAFLENYKLDLITKISRSARDDIKSQLRLGIIQGSSVTDISKAISNQYPKLADRTERIVRTEIARAQSEGHRHAYEKMDVQRVQVIGRGVNCPICGQHIGKIYRLDSAPHVPLHPNCRCDLIAVQLADGTWYITARQLDYVQNYELPENLSINRSVINRIKEEHPESLFVWNRVPETINQGSYADNVYTRQYSKPLIKNLRTFNIQTKDNKIEDAWLEN